LGGPGSPACADHRLRFFQLTTEDLRKMILIWYKKILRRSDYVQWKNLWFRMI